MADDFKVEKNTVNNAPQPQNNGERKVIEESAYRTYAPREKGPTAVGRGGDPFFRRINATNEQLKELMDEHSFEVDTLRKKEIEDKMRDINNKLTSKKVENL